MINARAGLNFFNYSFDGTESDVSYNVDLKLKSISLLIDFHPILTRGLRLSGGLILNSNGLDMVSDQISGTINVGGTTYDVGDVGSLNGSVDFESTAPYIGIGWGNAASSRFGFVLDLGIAFQGSPEVDLTATGRLATDSNFQQDLRREQNELQDDISGFKYYPVIGIGISIKITP